MSGPVGVWTLLLGRVDAVRRRVLRGSETWTWRHARTFSDLTTDLLKPWAHVKHQAAPRTPLDEIEASMYGQTAACTRVAGRTTSCWVPWELATVCGV